MRVNWKGGGCFQNGNNHSHGAIEEKTQTHKVDFFDTAKSWAQVFGQNYLNT